MTRLRLIPGAVGRETARALLIAAGGGQPTATIGPTFAPPLPAAVVPWPTGPELQAELDKDNVRLFTIRADDLAPATRHDLTANLDGAEDLVSFRTLPPGNLGELTVVAASCFYEYFHRDRHYLAALRSVYCRDAAFKILMGDNLYMDVAPDQKSVSGAYPENVARYLHYFRHSGYADVLARIPTVTTWDDHEFWNNFPERQCHLSRTHGLSRREYLRAGRECLAAFQAVLNPDTPDEDDLSYEIDETGPVSFFMADLRSRRTRQEDSRPEMMPERGLVRLEEWGRTLDRPGVLVLGQPLWLDEGGGGDWNPQDFKDQYARIWRVIADAPHDVLIVTGDVHHSRLIEIGLPTGRSVYEFTTSPACHIPTEASIAVGGYRHQAKSSPKVPGSVKVKGIKPMLGRYLFGTDAPNSIGVLRFRPSSGGVVAVGATFLDLLTGRPAESTRMKVSGSGHREPRFRKCHDEEVFKLR